VASLGLVACGGGGGKSGGRTVAVKLTDAGCEPASLTLPAGPTTFEVSNDGADAVTEFEVLEGDRILGEVENLAPGLSGRFSITLKPGRFVTYCPGGKTVERGSLVVTGSGDASTSAADAAAVRHYRAYVEGQTGLLVARTRSFVAALRAGDLSAARARYATARVPYERIEPVAESFGGLDPAIDARAGDVPAARWTGFHPIERALWVGGSTAGTGMLGARLLEDVARLQRQARTVELEPAQIANGAVELLGEVSRSKITGEEERYSHLDLVDFQANVEGARAAFDAVKPILVARRPELARRVDARFDEVEHALRPYRRGVRFVSYTELDRRDTRRLSQAIDALAEPLSQVAAIVVAAE
jgi:iron uptake system component EfeO